MAAHDRLAHQSPVVLRLGQMLLSFGASAYRVKKSMADLARAVGISAHRAQVTYTEIIATAYANGTFRTELAEQRLMGVNADKIDRINNYVASLHGKSVRVEDVSDELARSRRFPASTTGSRTRSPQASPVRRSHSSTAGDGSSALPSPSPRSSDKRCAARC